MAVRRIVANLNAADPAAAKAFYCDLLGLDQLMDFGWIATFGSNTTAPVQLSVASEGGSGTDVPDISIEVDNVDDVYQTMKEAGVPILYEIVDEPWGVRRFYARDPVGKVVNILSHTR